MEQNKYIPANKREQWYFDLGNHIIKNRWRYIGVLLVIVISAAFGLPKITFDTSVENWFPKSSQIFANKQKFESHFDNSDMVAIHVQAEDVFSRDILSMLDTLGRELETRVPFANEVMSIANMEYTHTQDDEIIVEDLVPNGTMTKDVLEASRRRAMNKEYIKGKLVSEDGTESWLTLELLGYPDSVEAQHGEAPENLVAAEVLEILGQDKYQGYQLRAVGAPLFAYEELLFTEKESLRLITYTLIISFIFLVIFFRSVTGVVAPFTTAIISIITIFGVMGHLGIKINAFLFAVPIILSFAVSIAYSVHLFNYFQRGLYQFKQKNLAIAYAISQSGWPTTFAAFTTIGALLSFMTIALIPIRWVGLSSAASIFAVCISVFIVTGVLLSFTNPKIPVHTKTFKTDLYFQRLGNWTFNHSRTILIIASLIIVSMVVGLSMLEVNIDTKRSYGMKVPYMKRMVDVAETQIGFYDSYNITIDFKETNAVKNPKNLEKFDEFIDEVHQLKLTKKTNSLLPILKDMNRIMHEGDETYYRIPESNQLVAQLLLIYEMSGGSRIYDWVNDDFSVLRLRVGTKDMNAKATMNEIKILEDLSGELFPKAEFNIAGALPKYAALNQYVATGQVKSLLLAIMVIGILMMVVFKSIKIGLIGLIPNLTPVLVTGGIMGFLDIPLDFVTVTIAPMILGIAVDDTIHFINHLKSDYKKKGDYYKASITTMQIVGKALFTTSFIIIIAFSIYLTSPFNMLKYLGLFIVVGIFIALVADLIITPITVKYLKAFKEQEVNPPRPESQRMKKDIL